MKKWGVIVLAACLLALAMPAIGNAQCILKKGTIFFTEPTAAMAALRFAVRGDYVSLKTYYLDQVMIGGSIPLPAGTSVKVLVKSLPEYAPVVKVSADGRVLYTWIAVLKCRQEEVK